MTAKNIHIVNTVRAILNFDYVIVKSVVCLFNQSVHADTRMGPEGTKLKQKPEPCLKSLYLYIYI